MLSWPPVGRAGATHAGSCRALHAIATMLPRGGGRAVGTQLCRRRACCCCCCCCCAVAVAVAVAVVTHAVLARRVAFAR
eukprot:6172818-Lingulodinium_polyedra.AAC.1